MTEPELTDFKEGDKVLYVPYHAKGDTYHPDCEAGTVHRVGAAYVFVLFKGTTPQACKPDQLVRVFAASPAPEAPVSQSEERPTDLEDEEDDEEDEDSWLDEHETPTGEYPPYHEPPGESE